MATSVEILNRLQSGPPTAEQVRGWLGRPPQLVLVDLGKRCNLWCEDHCGYPGQQLRQEAAIARGEKMGPTWIDVDVLKQAYDEISTAWVPHKPQIQVSADGEPLMHKRALEALCYPAEELGLGVGLTTNGILLKAPLVEKLCTAGVRLINVSLDAASAETYAQVRPTRNRQINFFHLVTENIREAVRVRDELAKTREIVTQLMITMIVRPETVGEREGFIALGQEMGVDKVSFRPLNTTAGLILLPSSETERIKIDAQGGVTEVGGVPRYPCHFPFTRFSLSVGDKPGSINFVFCPHAWDRQEAVLGAYPKGGSLSEMWRSPQIEAIRSAHLTGAFKPRSICATCPDWRFVTGRDQITYADLVKNG